MSGNQSNAPGSASGTPQPGASAAVQNPDISMNQPINSSGLAFQQQLEWGNPQFNQVPMNDNQTFMSGNQTFMNSNQVPMSGNQAPMNGNQTFMNGNQTFMNSNQVPMSGNQAQHMHTLNATNNMYVHNMQNAFSYIQPSFLGNAPPMGMGDPYMGMTNYQTYFTNGNLMGGGMHPTMGYHQSCTFGQTAAPNTTMPMDFQGMHSTSMSFPQSNIQQVQAHGFRQQITQPSLNPTATSFTPTMGNIGLQQRVSPQRNMPAHFQMTPNTATPVRTREDAYRDLVEFSKKSAAERKRAARQRYKERRAAKSDPDATKRHKNPVEDKVISKVNKAEKTSQRAELQDSLRRVSSGRTIPQDVGLVDMTPNPKPASTITKFLLDPDHNLITHQTSDMQQPPQDPFRLPVSSRASLVNEPSSGVTSEELPSNSLSTQPQLNAPEQCPAGGEMADRSGEPELSKKEHWLREAEAEGRTIPPSQRRVIRFERDDVRLERDENGEPITPPDDMYNGTLILLFVLKDENNEKLVYYVAPPDELSVEAMLNIVNNFMNQSPEEKALTLNTKGNKKNKDGKLTTKPAGETSVTKRCNDTQSASAASASQVGATDIVTLTDIPPHHLHDNSNAVVTEPNFGIIPPYHSQDNNNAVVAEPNFGTTPPCHNHENSNAVVAEPNFRITPPYHSQDNNNAVVAEPNFGITTAATSSNSNAVVAQPNFNAGSTVLVFPQSCSQTVPEVGNAATIPSYAQVEHSSPHDSQSIEHTNGVFNNEGTTDLLNGSLDDTSEWDKLFNGPVDDDYNWDELSDCPVDPALAQDHQMQQVSEDLSEGIQEQPSPAAEAKGDMTTEEKLVTFLGHYSTTGATTTAANKRKSGDDSVGVPKKKVRTE